MKNIALRMIGVFLVALMTVQIIGIDSSVTQMQQVEAATKTGTIKYPAYMRKSASTKSKIYFVLLRGKKVKVIRSTGNWYKVKYSNTYGYIQKLYVSVKNTGTSKTTSTSKTGTVKSSYLNFRKSASTKSKVIKILKKGTKVTILQSGTSWYKVKYNGKTGYVKKGYISVGSSAKSSSQSSYQVNKASTSKVTGSQVVNYAVQFVGNRYVWGGTSLTNGADCSGFTMSVYRNFGYNLPRTSLAQRTTGKRVASIAQAKPGDLICYNGHVAIYMGNNKIVHAANSKKGIIISNTPYIMKIVGIRRII